MSELEELFDYLIEERSTLKDLLVEDLEDLSMFRMGQYRGRILSLDSIIEHIRRKIKYRDE